jgi:hypothetical protein
MTTSRNLYGVNLSQPDWNNMEAVWSATRERHIVVLDLRQEYLPPGTRTGVTLRR